MSVVGDEVRVEACPERTYYPGWNCTFVAGGKVRDLANPKRIFYTAGLPLDLIMKDPIY